ncbi:MAG TPA: DUF998 domain-containing protein [Propionicimonas sp.]|nr:DUF998 domain-containing protein [Propionicimonas sp.]
MSYKGALRLLGLGVAALLLGIAPAFLAPGEGYSWIVQTTSESAAQGASGAWVARLGFVTWGLTVLWFVADRSRLAQPVPRVALRMFGVLLMVVAACSHRHWLPSVPFDPVEDQLHSIAASLMGFVFVLALLALALSRSRPKGLRLLNAVGAVASIVLPALMAVLPEWAGLLQRSMFAIAFVWFGVQIVSSERSSHVS